MLNFKVGDVVEFNDASALGSIALVTEVHEDQVGFDAPSLNSINSFTCGDATEVTFDGNSFNVQIDKLHITRIIDRESLGNPSFWTMVSSAQGSASSDKDEAEEVPELKGDEVEEVPELKGDEAEEVQELKGVSGSKIENYSSSERSTQKLGVSRQRILEIVNSTDEFVSAKDVWDKLGASSTLQPGSIGKILQFLWMSGYVSKTLPGSGNKVLYGKYRTHAKVSDHVASRKQSNLPQEVQEKSAVRSKSVIGASGVVGSRGLKLGQTFPKSIDETVGGSAVKSKSVIGAPGVVGSRGLKLGQTFPKSLDETVGGFAVRSKSVIGASGVVGSRGLQLGQTFPKSIDEAVGGSGNCPFVTKESAEVNKHSEIKFVDSSKIALNGFGRAGQSFAKAAFRRKDVDLVAINDPSFNPDTMQILLKYAETYGQWETNKIFLENGNTIVFGNKRIHIFKSLKLEDIPWGKAGAETVIDTTDLGTLDEAKAHLKGGALRVIVAKFCPGIPLFVFGVNELHFRPEHKILSCGNPATQCVSPFLKIINDKFGINELLFTVVQSATESNIGGNGVEDMFDLSASSIDIPMAVEALLPQLKGRLAGAVVNSFTLDVAAVTISVRFNEPTTLDTINSCIKEVSHGGILGFVEDSASSSDFLDDDRSCIFDLTAGKELNNQSFILICWFSRYGYSSRLIDFVRYIRSQDVASA